MSKNSQINLFFSYIDHYSEEGQSDFDADGCLYEMSYESLPNEAHVSDPVNSSSPSPIPPHSLQLNLDHMAN